MRRIAKGIAGAHDVTIDVTYDTVFPAIRNDASAAAAALQAARNCVGTERVDGDCDPKLFSEDFAHMTKAVPGCFVLIGNGTEGAHARPLHASDYDFNDEILVTGASFIATLVEQQLGASGPDQS